MAVVTHLTTQSNQAFSAQGGSSTFQTLSFNNANGVTFSNVGGAVQASYTVPTLTAFVFSNSNGVSFGTNGSTVTATVATNYQPAGAYLTTARASNDAVGLNTALTAGPLAWTVNSSGISLNGGSAAGTTSGFGGNLISGSMTHNTAGLNLSLNHPAWLTTAMQSNAVTLSNIRVSGGTTSNLLSAITFGDANGVSFGLNAGTMTASHNALTTAAQSNHSHGNPTLNLTNLSGTTASNSAGFTLSLSAAAPGGGVTPALSGSNGSFTYSTATFGNLNGLSFYTSNGSLVGSHNGLTTARASTDAIGLNTALTAGPLAWTVNSSGLSLNAGSVAGTTTGFAGANISGSMTHNTAGLNLSLSVAAPGAAAENNWMNALGANTAGNTTASGSTIGLSGINLTISGTNNSVFNFSVPATSSLSATGRVSLSTNGSTISIGVPNEYTFSGYQPYADYEFTTMGQSQGTLSIEPMVLPNVQFDRVVFPINNTNSSNSSGSHSLSFRVGIYTLNASTLSLVASASGSTAITHSGTAGSYSLFSGMRLFTIPMTTTLTAGRYWLAFNSNTTSGGANGSYSLFGLSQIANNFLGHFGSSHNTTYQFTLGQGIYTASTTGIPGSIGISQIRGSDSTAFRSPIIGFASSTI